VLTLEQQAVFQSSHQRPSSLLSPAKSFWPQDIIFSPSWIGKVYFSICIMKLVNTATFYFLLCEMRIFVTQQLNKPVVQHPMTDWT